MNPAPESDNTTNIKQHQYHTSNWLLCCVRFLGEMLNGLVKTAAAVGLGAVVAHWASIDSKSSTILLASIGTAGVALTVASRGRMLKPHGKAVFITGKLVLTGNTSGVVDEVACTAYIDLQVGGCIHLVTMQADQSDHADNHLVIHMFYLFL